MKRNIFTLAVLFIASVALAQSSAEARKMLDKAYAAYENAKGIEIAFTATATEANGTAYQPQKGVAKVKGNKFTLDMPGMNTWFDGKTQWVLMEDLNEVNVSNPTGEEIASISPLALLNMYKTGYTLKAPVSKTVNGKNVHFINMAPVGNKSDFKDISVALDKASNNIVQVNLTMKNGMKTKIDINKYNANANYADSEFIFNKSNHKGVEVIDLR